MGYFISFAFLILAVIGVKSCADHVINPPPRYWYAVEIFEARCASGTYTVARYKHSQGVRTWPYFREVSTGDKLTFQDSGCVFVTIDTSPELPNIPGEIGD